MNPFNLAGRAGALLLATLPLWAAPLCAADPPQAKLSGPKAVEVGSAIILNPTGSVGDVEFGLASGPGPAPVIRLKSDDGQTVIGFGTAAVPGTYVFVCTAWGEPVKDGRPAHSFAFWSVTVGTPAPPVPPGPQPPNPDDPTPDPFGGAQSAAPAFRCLIVYESADLSKLPPAQLTAITSAQVRDYLNTHCAVGPDGKTKEWRVWDADTNVSAESPLWQKMMAKKRAKLPWLYLGNGTKGYDGPFPENTDKLMAILKRFGGP